MKKADNAAEEADLPDCPGEKHHNADKDKLQHHEKKNHEKKDHKKKNHEKKEAEYAANIAALEKAIAAIESGRAGSFIQTPAAKLLEARAAVEGDLAMTEKGLADSKYSLVSAEQNCA